jgi:anti-anti-sigma factor
MGDDEASPVDVQLGGETDLASAREIGDDLFAAVDRASERLVVDLTDVTFLDSTAMAMMIRVHNYALARSKRVTWWNIQPIAATVIKVIALDQVLDFAP